MEEVLQLYTSIDNPRYPLVCFDEASKQLVKETRLPLPPEPGQTQGGFIQGNEKPDAVDSPKL